ncbi:MAG: 4-alpha-glucanotransferase, partial [Alphaproteobacteria bacterium]|nr:4-alpha-glucanotransferase [Alphaproteobacteria bacterium]
MTALDRLADAVGIEPGYHDIWGQWRPVSDTAKRAILDALGLPAADEAAVETSLARLARRRWDRVVDPVSVVGSEAQPGGIGVIVPADGDRTVAWTLTLEDGTRHEGRAPADALHHAGQFLLDGRALDKHSLIFPDGLPEGYHTVAVTIDGRTGEAPVIVAPATCWGPDDAAPGRRPWGLACQLYSLRSETDWGLGGFPELGALTAHAAAAGADIVGINPPHALFPANPKEASPYSPASRDFLNVLYIDPTAVADWAEAPAARAIVEDSAGAADLAAARGADRVDYGAVAALKMPVLRALWDAFRDNHLARATERAHAFEAFRADGGPALERFAAFMAMHAAFGAADPFHLDWRHWPEDYRDPRSPAVAAWAEEHADDVAFQVYLQWLADLQLGAAARHGAEAGLGIGLYRDLAVGVGPASAAAWAAPETLVRDASVGAPPDPFSRLGQDWGLCPLDPLALLEQGYRPFARAIAANMRHAGALRIDHVLGLMRLYWVPKGMDARDGAYVSMPFDDLLRVVALESRRQHCLVIGEDLGTVPEGFRDRMTAAGLLSYKVLLFERVGDMGLFKDTADYPAEALVTAGTHDLPPLAGWWAARDVDWRRDLGLYPDAAAAESDAEDRAADRDRLLAAL